MNATYVPDLKCVKLMRMHACASRSFTVLHYDYTYIHVSIVIKLRQNDFKNPFELLVFVIKSREETSCCFRMNSSTTARDYRSAHHNGYASDTMMTTTLHPYMNEKQFSPFEMQRMNALPHSL